MIHDVFNKCTTAVFEKLIHFIDAHSFYFFLSIVFFFTILRCVVETTYRQMEYTNRTFANRVRYVVFLQHPDTLSFMP